MPSPVAARNGGAGVAVRVEMSGASELLDVEEGAGASDEVGRGEVFDAVTTRWVGRMVMPGASMLTKVIIMAASGKAGWGAGAGVAVGVTEGELVLVAGNGLVEGQFELGGALLGVGDGGFVAVVAIGDDELLVGHGGERED